MISCRISDQLCIALTSIVCIVMLGSTTMSAQLADPASRSQLLSNPPEARSPIDLSAINDPQTGKAAFSFDGREVPPVIRALPGEDSRLPWHQAVSRFQSIRSAAGAVRC